MKIDHIGYAVKEMESAITDFQNLGFKFTGIITDKDRNVNISFGNKDGYRIELISPSEGGEYSPVDDYLKKNGWSTPYHLCYLSENIKKDIEVLEQQKYKLISLPSPACAFGGAKVAFLLKRTVGLVELVEDNGEKNG